MVQSQTLYPTLCYYEDSTASRLVVGQYIPSVYQRSDNVTITQSVDMKYYNDGAFFDEHDDSRMSRWFLKFTVKANTPETFALSFRVPDWTKHRPVVILNGEEQKDITVHNGYLDIEKEWTDDVISLYFTAPLTTSTLSDMPDRVAFLEGPVVLAGLCDKDFHITMDSTGPESVLAYVTEHTYDTFPWQQSTYRTVNQTETITLAPLYDITDEPYTIYFSTKYKETL